MSILRTTAICAAAMLASALLSGCVKGPHFDNGGLATALSWLDSDDEKTIVSDVRLWAHGPEAGRQAAATSAAQAATAPQALTASQSLGSLAADLHFSSAADLAATLIPLEEGRYTVLGAVNLTAPFSCAGSAADLEFSLDPTAYNAASQSTAVTASQIAASQITASQNASAAAYNAESQSASIASQIAEPLSASAASRTRQTEAASRSSYATQPSATRTAGPAHAFYGVTQVNISDRAKITVAPVAIRRILSELTIIIEDAPQGAKLSGEVLDAAASFFPLRPDTDGNYGLASEWTMTVTIPETPQTASAGQSASPETLVSPTLRLMPTASGREFSHLRILLTTPEGEQFEFRIEAPLMRPSGKYVVNLKYDQMRPYMRLSVHNINDWTEGWIYNGEILDPTVASAEVIAPTATPTSALAATPASARLLDSTQATELLAPTQSAATQSAASVAAQTMASASAPTIASVKVIVSTQSAATPASAEFLAATVASAELLAATAASAKGLAPAKASAVSSAGQVPGISAAALALTEMPQTAMTPTPAPVRTKSIPCVKSRLVRTGAEENYPRAHEAAWCAQNSSRAHGTLATPYVALATPHDNRVAVWNSQASHGTLATPYVALATPHDNRVAVWSSQASHGTLVTPHVALATPHDNRVAVWSSQEPHGTLVTPHVALATPHDNRVAVWSSQEPHGNWSGS